MYRKDSPLKAFRWIPWWSCVWKEIRTRIANRSLPLLLKSWCHWEMDGDQQLNVYYWYSVAIMDRFICQPKFTGKRYLKFEGQESKQRIKPESKPPISKSVAHRHAQSSIAAFTLCWQIVLMHWTSYPWELQLSAISCIINKNSIRNKLRILCIFIWIFTLSTAQLQRAAWTSMKTSKRKQRTGIYETNALKHMQIYKEYAKIMHNMQQICTICNKYATGAEERASFSASKLACASSVHMKRAVGLPSAVSGAASSE